jgi:hypothetical protein
MVPGVTNFKFRLVSPNNIIFGKSNEWIITSRERESEQNYSVSVNISILSDMARGMYYSFFTVAKISVLGTIRKFNTPTSMANITRKHFVCMCTCVHARVCMYVSKAVRRSLQYSVSNKD